MEKWRPAPPFSAVRRAASDFSRRHRPVRLSAAIPVLIPALALCSAAPAIAQVSVAVAAESDLRVRGYSLSGGQPTASVKVSYDDGSGFYADGSATEVVTRKDGPRFLGYQVDAGMAKRVNDMWTIDVGIVRNEFRAAYPQAFQYAYTEVYAGATRGPFSAYVFVSPNYFDPGAWTLYGQIEGSVAPAADWRLTAHVGSLNYLSSSETYAIRPNTKFDWRVGITREFGNFEAHAALSGGGPGREYYHGYTHSRTALTAGAAISF
jgi:uncharacterized protein (TIGR02001 family)